MARKFFPIFAILAVAGVGLFFFFQRQMTSPKYIFINETFDHRFDESIRVSIMAATLRTGVQNAVVITDRYPPLDLEKAAHELFTELEVGRGQKGRGILYLYSPTRKTLKIEVGYALEGLLPDITVRGLELAAKNFIYTSRYQDFWAELINTLNIEVQEHDGPDHAPETAYDFANFRFLSGGAGVASRSYSPDEQQRKKEVLAANHLGTSFETKNIPTTIDAYLRSLKEGNAGDQLNFLSAETHDYRAKALLTSYQLFRNWRMYTKAGVDRVFEENGFGFVFFKPGHPVLPIVLKNVGGLWHIQEPLAWSLFQRFEDSSRVFLKYPLAGISREMTEYLSARIGPALYPLTTPIQLAGLAKSPPQIDLQDLYFLRYDLEQTAQWFGARKLHEMATDQLWIAADTFMNLGQMTEFAATYSLAASRSPGDKKLATDAEFYRTLVNFKTSEWRLRR